MECAWTAVEILAEVVRGNALSEQDIDKQKTIVLKELEASVGIDAGDHRY